MSVPDSDRTDPHVESVALLAAWCESPAHLSQPPVEEALQEANFRQLCALVARNWDSSEPLSPALRAELEAQAQQAAAREAAERHPQLTAAEISQRSVDLLLREYYQMMRAKHQSTARQPADASAGSGLGRLFLLMCPAGPDCCSLSSLAAALLWTAHAAASSIVLLGCLLIPLWLAAIRHLFFQQQTRLGAAVAVGGLMLLLAADALHKSAAARRHAAVAAAITPATLAARSPGVAGSGELRLLAQAGKRSNDNKAGASSSAAQQGTSSAAAAAAGSSSGALSYLSLVPHVCALQSALGLSGGDPPTSRERLQQDITRLCQVMGLPLAQASLTSPTAMAAVLAELKSSVGI